MLLPVCDLSTISSDHVRPASSSCWYVYKYIYVYVYICIYVHVHIYIIYIYLYRRIYMYTHINTNLQKSERHLFWPRENCFFLLLMYMNVYICMNMNICIYACIHISVYINIWQETYNFKKPDNRSHPYINYQNDLFYKALLQKRTVIWRSLLTVATPISTV